MGTAVMPGDRLVVLEPAVDTPHVHAPDDSPENAAEAGVRADLTESIERHAAGLDEARPDAVARRRQRGRRTARENVADLVDDGSFVEYGPLVIAAQRRRRDLADLIANTPADGLVGGIGTVNGELFGPERARCIAMSYDYTVLAGTQGMQNHRKKDRLFELAETLRLPIVFFTEGGGGRPGDTDGTGPSGLDCLAFLFLAELSGLVPLVGVNAGYCFAGNAAILGCCDVVIATLDSNIGMGGPAMIEGGGLGVYEPTAVGPIDVQRANGVVDIVVADEAEAVAVAKRYLSYFQGRTDEWECADQTLLRDVVPADRLRSYDVRRAVDLLFDTDSVLELRRDFGLGMITALARIEGRPVGVLANNPTHLAGAIDTPRRRQGGAVHAALRRLRPAADHAVRHAGDDGRPGRRGDGARAPLQPPVRHRRQPHRADGDDRAAQGLRARRPGDDGRLDQGAAGVPGVADRRVRRDGAGGRRAPRLPPRARRDRRSPGHARSCSASWSTACTRSARRSASPRTSRSTTSSTQPTPVAG